MSEEPKPPIEADPVMQRVGRNAQYEPRGPNPDNDTRWQLTEETKDSPLTEKRTMRYGVG